MVALSIDMTYLRITSLTLCDAKLEAVRTDAELSASTVSSSSDCKTQPHCSYPWNNCLAPFSEQAARKGACCRGANTVWDSHLLLPHSWQRSLASNCDTSRRRQTLLIFKTDCYHSLRTCCFMIHKFYEI